MTFHEAIIGGGYSSAIGVFIVSLLVLYIIKNIIIVRIKKFASKTKTHIDDILIESAGKIAWPFYFVIALYISFQFVVLPAVVEKSLDYIALIVITYYLVKALSIAIDYLVTRHVEEKAKSGKAHQASVIKLTSSVARVTLWIIAVIFILSNLGFNISSLIAGLGIGGIALALALQNVLGDIFSSISIYLDKPFEVGDFIIVGDDMGVVKKIGIKSTRLETLHGQELIVSNKELTTIRINNYKKMKKRRIVFSIGVVYETKTEKLEKIPKITAEIFKKVKNAELDRVNFREFGPYSLNYEIVYYMLDPNYTEYIKAQEKINLELKREFEKEKIDMAFPSQTLYLKK